MGAHLWNALKTMPVHRSNHFPVANTLIMSIETKGDKKKMCIVGGLNCQGTDFVPEYDVKLLAPFRPLTGRQGFDVERVTCAISSLHS